MYAGISSREEHPECVGGGRALAWESIGLNLVSRMASSELCDLGSVTHPLRVSVSSYSKFSLNIVDRFSEADFKPNDAQYNENNLTIG